jgi:hypothetical protein
MSKIEKHVIEEGNLRAVKDTSDFGGPNHWELQVKDTDGWFRDVQWMNVSKIQNFFKTPLPRYEEISPRNYKKV